MGKLIYPTVTRVCTRADDLERVKTVDLWYQGSFDMVWITFFVTKSNISRTEPLETCNMALDAACNGPPGAMFQISRFATNPGETDQFIVEGYVAG